MPNPDFVRECAQANGSDVVSYIYTYIYIYVYVYIHIHRYIHIHLFGRLSDMPDPDIVCECAQSNGSDVVSVAAERLDGGDGAVVQPVEVGRVEIILDDVLPVAA